MDKAAISAMGPRALAAKAAAAKATISEDDSTSIVTAMKRALKQEIKQDNSWGEISQILVNVTDYDESADVWFSLERQLNELAEAELRGVYEKNQEKLHKGKNNWPRWIANKIRVVHDCYWFSCTVHAEELAKEDFERAAKKYAEEHGMDVADAMDEMEAEEEKTKELANKVAAAKRMEERMAQRAKKALGIAKASAAPAASAAPEPSTGVGKKRKATLEASPEAAEGDEPEAAEGDEEGAVREVPRYASAATVARTNQLGAALSKYPKSKSGDVVVSKAMASDVRNLMKGLGDTDFLKTILHFADKKYVTSTRRAMGTVAEDDDGGAACSGAGSSSSSSAPRMTAAQAAVYNDGEAEEAGEEEEESGEEESD